MWVRARAHRHIAHRGAFSLTCHLKIDKVMEVALCQQNHDTPMTKWQTGRKIPQYHIASVKNVLPLILASTETFFLNCRTSFFCSFAPSPVSPLLAPLLFNPVSLFHHSPAPPASICVKLFQCLIKAPCAWVLFLLLSEAKRRGETKALSVVCHK